MSRPTILCVDDEYNVLLTLRTQLSWHFPDYTIEIAQSAVEALELVDRLFCEGLEIALAIADQIMPGIKGDRFLIELHIHHPEIIKVMLTGQANVEDVGHLVTQGNLYRCIAKPWDEIDLQLTVREALRRYQQERQLTQQQAELDRANRQLAALKAKLDRQVQASTQQALQESEANLKKAQEIAHLGHWEFNFATRQVYWSEELYRIHGLDPNQPILIGEDGTGYIHPDDRAKYREEILEKVAIGERFATDLRIFHTDGSIRFIEARGEPLLNANNQLIGFRGTVQDITDRKQMEQALRESAERLRVALEAARMGSWDWNILTDRIVWSESLERLMGLEPGTFDGSLETVAAMIYPDDRQRVIEAITRSVERDDDYDIEFRFVKPDGSIRWAAGKGKVLRDRSGRAVRMVGVDVDITDRKLTELALKESETRFLELSEVSPANIYIIVRRVDGSIYFEHISRAIEIIHEIPVEKFLENANIIEEHIHPEDLAGYQLKVQQSMENFAPFSYEWRIITSSGKIKWIQGNSRPKLRDNGEIAWYGVVIDITDRKQVEEALQKSEERWSLAIEASNDGIWDNNDFNKGENSKHFLSPRCMEMVGYNYEEIDTYQKWFNYVHPEDQSFLKTTCQAYLNRQTPSFTCEYRILCKDGSYKWILARAKAIWDENGIPVRVIGSFTDITIRRQYQIALEQLNEELERRVCQRTEELARSERDLRTIFNNVYDALLIQDMDGTVLDVNDRALELLNATRKQLIGAIIPDLAAPSVTPESITEELKKLQTLETLQIESRSRRFGDNSYFDVEVSLRKVKLGNRNVFIAAVRDISDRKRAEMALRASERRYATLAEVAPVAIFRFDIPLNCTYVSDRWSEMTGRSVESALGTGWMDALHPDDRDRLLREWAQGFDRSLPGTQIFNCSEGRHLRPDGNINWFYVQVVQEIDTDGTVVGYIGTLTDITYRKHTEEQLQRINEELICATRLKDEFLATMSHELRTPLNVILGMTEGLKDGIFGEINERQLEALQAIDLSGSHLQSLINDILDITKIESGQMEIDCRPTDIAYLCQSSFLLIRQQALKKRIELELKLPPNLPILLVDERRICQVLVNLLNNAIKFTTKGGRITLEVISEQKPANLDDSNSTAQNFLRIAVIDTGIGIAPQDIKKLFQPFVQIDSALNRKYEGTGVGLTLVKRIVELHGGRVGVTSEVGVGSCFTIDLPCTTDLNSFPQLATQPKLNTTSRAVQNEASHLLLLAQDNEANIITIVSYLTAKGYPILVAKNGQELIALAKSEQPDVILMDIQMSGMNSLEIIQQIRRDPSLGNVPIIALTTPPIPNHLEQCLGAVINDYVNKPVKLKQLVDMIKRLI